MAKKGNVAKRGSKGYAEDLEAMEAALSAPAPVHLTRIPDNLLYYGDNLDILRRYIEDESIDLIYLDPPFNSKADYQGHAQIQAFEDTWQWDVEAAQEYAGLPGMMITER